MRYLRAKVLLKGSVLQGQCLSFRFDKLIFMSKAPHTILQLARRGMWLGVPVMAAGSFASKRVNLCAYRKASLGSLQVTFPHTLPALHVSRQLCGKWLCLLPSAFYFEWHFLLAVKTYLAIFNCQI